MEEDSDAMSDASSESSEPVQTKTSTRKRKQSQKSSKKSAKKEVAPVRNSSRQQRIVNKLLDDCLNKVYKMEEAIYFMRPVDPVELDIPDYFDIVTKPMDLGTVKARLGNLEYDDHESFGEDVRLTFVNAYTYNHQEENPVHVAAVALEEAFKPLYERLSAAVQQKQEEFLAENTSKGSSSKSGKSGSGKFTEADSDDEFAIKNFTYGEDSKKSKSKGQSKSKGKAKNSEAAEVAKEESEAASESSESESESEDDEDDGPEFRVQHVLATKTMAAGEWRDVCEHMNTREITRGSAWKQDDEDFFDLSEAPVTKYLIKWMHASFLHVSWETEKDLVELVGTTAKTQLKKFHVRIALDQDLFEDLGHGEFFLPTFTSVERILDVDDPRVDIRSVDWENALLPEFDPIEQPFEEYDEENDSEAEEETNGSAMVIDLSADADADAEIDLMDTLSGVISPTPSRTEKNASADADGLLDSESFSEMVSPNKFNPEEFRALVGGEAPIEMLNEDSNGDLLGALVASPLPVSAKKGDDNLGLDEDDDLFDSDEEREISDLNKPDIRSPMKDVAPLATSPGGVDGLLDLELSNDGTGMDIGVSSSFSSPAPALLLSMEVDTDAADVVQSELEPKPLKKSQGSADKKADKKALKEAREKAIKTKKARKERELKAIMAEEGPCDDLHGAGAIPGGGAGTIWVTVKWEGLAYSDSSYEDLRDLQRMYIDFEAPMRAFFKREQLPPTKGTTKVRRALNAAVMEAKEGPALPEGRELRDYQWEGVRWLMFNWSQRRNSILADEMGLGKTIQSAVFLQMLSREQGMRGPFLVVAPLSTVVQWQREVSSWTDMDAIIYHGSTEDREVLRNYDFGYMSRKKQEGGYKLQVVITTPETCMSADSKTATGLVRRELCKIKWDMLIVDEAHKLKNYDSKVGNILRDEFEYLNCMLLTGTPLQNNTDELWTLLNFVAREEFGDREDFTSEFGDLKEASQLEKLHARLKPYLLRREKENVEKKVPPKEEVIVEVELTVPQKQYYRAIYEQKTGFLYKGGAKDGPSLSNLAMELRKCCNHPFLIKGAETELSKHFEGETPLNQLVKSSGKMMLLDKLLPKLKQDGHRVLIFSQFRIMLNIIEDYMIMKGYLFERIDGAITGRKRQNAIDRYTNNKNEDGKEEIFAMLLSTRAGGVGINLTAADTVIIFDSDWNPQNDIQAQARAHRIGQTKKVKVYRFITKKSYETAMFRAASIKLGLDYAVMGGVKSNGSSGSSGMAGITDKSAENFSNMSKKELENLLKHGAYDIFNEEKDGTGAKESQRFLEDDIDAILERSSVVVHGGDKKAAAAASNAGFSKASFVTNEGADDVAMDDPEFWSKVVGLAEGQGEELTQHGRRRDKMEKGAYKEPGMTFTVLESDDDSSDDEFGSTRGRGKSGKNSDMDEAAEFTEANMSRVLQALCSHGYGHWSAIRRSSRLKWAHRDLAVAARSIVLQLLCFASLENDKGVNGSAKFWQGIGRPADSSIEQEQWGYEDLQFIEDFLNKHKAVRLALCAYDTQNTPEFNNHSTCKTIEELYDACVVLPQAVFFKKAVDPVALDIPDYFDLIKKPMDLGLIKRHMQSNSYDGDHVKFAEHMRLTFWNAYEYNHMVDNPVHVAGKAMEEAFNEKYEAFLAYLVSRPVEEAIMQEAAQKCGAMDFDFLKNSSDKTSNFSTSTLVYQNIDVVPVERSGADDDLVALTEQNDAKLQKKHEMLRALVIKIRSSPSLMEFNLWEGSDSKGITSVRSHSRSKLKQIEDLFECHLLSGVVSGGGQWDLPTAPVIDELKRVESSAVITADFANAGKESGGSTYVRASSPVSMDVDGAKVDGTPVSAIITADFGTLGEKTEGSATTAGTAECSSASSPQSNSEKVADKALITKVVDLAPLQAYLDACKHLEAAGDDMSGWTSRCDAWLVTQVDHMGWPEGKRRQAEFSEAWEGYVKTNKLDTLDSSNSTANMSAPMEVEEGEKVENSDESAQTKAKTNVPFPADLMKTKFPSRRAKDICLALRGGSEAAADKLAKEAAKLAAQAAKAKAATEKAAALLAKKEAALPKTVLNAMQRFGRPREGHEQLLESLISTLPVQSTPAPGSTEKSDESESEIDMSKLSRDIHIVTYDMFSKECGLTALSDGSYDTTRLRAIVAEIVEVAYNTQNPTTAGEEIMTEGSVLAGSTLTPKAIVSAMEKADIIHRVRQACAVLDASSIKQGIAATCKGAGPSVGPARRDTSLPVWWTDEHDINLLLLVSSQALYGQWKKLSSNKLISDAPTGFVMPSRMQGFEWVTALTPKIVEKRIAALAQGLAKHISSLQGAESLGLQLPPGSPERVAGGKKTVVSAAKGKGKSGVKGAAPLITKMENYKAPTWINAFKSSKTTTEDKTKDKKDTAFGGAATLRNMSITGSSAAGSSTPAPASAANTVDLTETDQKVEKESKDKELKKLDPAAERAIGKANMSMVTLAGLSPLASPPSNKRAKIEKVEKTEQKAAKEIVTVSSVVTEEKPHLATKDSLQAIAPKKSLDAVFSNANDIIDVDAETDGVTPEKGLNAAASVTPATVVGKKRASESKKDSAAKKQKPVGKKEKKEKEVPAKPKGNILNFFGGGGNKVKVVE